MLGLCFNFLPELRIELIIIAAVLLDLVQRVNERLSGELDGAPAGKI